MTAGCPSSASKRTDPEQELENELLRGRMERIGQKLLVLSGKGGVGKSTVTFHGESPHENRYPG
jgi:Mrp family chromosome partitioning ATPase